MKQFTGISLRTRLYLLFLAAMIPVTVLIVFVAVEQETFEKDAILHRTKLMVLAAASAEDLQIAATHDLMTALTGTIEMVDGQPKRMSAFLRNLHDQTEGYAIFGVLDPQGRLIAGSRASSITRDYRIQPWFSTSLMQKRPAMGPYSGDRIDGVPVLYFAHPILDGGEEIMAVAFTALNLDRMNRRLFEQLAELPTGSRLTLVDENQGVLRYTVDTTRWSAAHALDPALLQKIVTQPSGVITADDEKGMSRIYAFTHLESAFGPRRVAVVLDIPQASAMAAAKHIFVRNLVLLVVSALMAVLSIWWAAHALILRRVGAMVTASRRLAAGDLRTRIGRIGARDELNHLAGVFDEMAASLQMRIEGEEQVKASLERSKEQLRRLSVYQNEVREQERIRIAREIHDQLGQSLTILKMDLSWIRKHTHALDTGIEAKMTAMADVIEAAVDKLHAVTAELRPVMLDDFGLAAAIEWQAEAFAQRSGIPCRLENNGFEPDLPKAQATALFRIFQETLTNIMRHAQASEVVVRLEKRGDELYLQVADNGRGITSEEINAPDAFGLLGIRERLYPFGGRVVFDGRPGHGTRVTIHLPMPKEGDNQ
jgi:signal transduction histidine kinase